METTDCKKRFFLRFSKNPAITKTDSSQSNFLLSGSGKESAMFWEGLLYQFVTPLHQLEPRAFGSGAELSRVRDAAARIPINPPTGACKR
jgi:hypothetical protein